MRKHLRILVANDGIDDSGGVKTYLFTLFRGLLERGHEVAFLSYNRQTPNDLPPELNAMPRFGVLDEGESRALGRARAWAPHVCYSNNMSVLELESHLLDHFRVVKFMHGYFGTCISNLKMHRFPTSVPCSRKLSPACLGFYFARRCGKASLPAIRDGYRWSSRQRELFARYAALVVASDHMKREYIRHGAEPHNVVVNPLFTPCAANEAAKGSSVTHRSDVLFIGRMTHLKGGDMLLKAAAVAGRKLGRGLTVTMAGDGPQRPQWEQMASQFGVKARFTGWANGEQLEQLYRDTTLLAIPSVWPEPFGLTGLEAGQFGVPAVAFDVGGISQWLHDGINGVLVRGSRPHYQAMGQVLADVLSQPDRLEMMRRGARQLAEQMSIDAHLDQLEHIFSRV